MDYTTKPNSAQASTAARLQSDHDCEREAITDALPRQPCNVSTQQIWNKAANSGVEQKIIRGSLATMTHASNDKTYEL